MRGALAGAPIDIRRPDAVRPWQHVLNPLSGYLALARALWDEPAHAGAWNFGPSEDEARPVRWVLERLAARWEGSLTWSHDDGEHPPEAHYLKIDSSRARARLGWQPGWSLEQALDSIVDWYASLATGADMRTVTLEQIGAFEGVS
jgi:CDP-glucose 4,6-dehydratase